MKGLGFSGALTLLFIALKLLGIISWSWIWVVAPLWIGAALVAIIFLVAFAYALTNSNEDGF